MEKKLFTALLANDRPATIEPLSNGQGTFLYNFNIQEVTVDSDFSKSEDEEDSTPEKKWQYDSLRVDYPKTANNIFSTLLTAKYPSDIESKLVNEYQSAVIGLMDESAKKPYEDFLRDRLSLRDMVDADCAALNIPNNL